MLISEGGDEGGLCSCTRSVIDPVWPWAVFQVLVAHFDPKCQNVAAKPPTKSAFHVDRLLNGPAAFVLIDILAELVGPRRAVLLASLSKRDYDIYRF